MELTLANLNVQKEKTYYAIAVVISLIAWIIVAITIVGMFYVLVFAFFIWLGNGLLIANLKSNAVRIDQDQLPLLHKTYQNVCQKLGVTQPPELYLLESAGALNAFATRHAGRDFVVLYSEIVDAYGQESDEIHFILGHELGHIKSRHLAKRLFIGPALFLPLLGPAYHRACETSCDTYGASVTNDVDGAIRAMMILSGGRDVGKELNSSSFASQYRKHRGFFISWLELISGYPTLSRRVAYLQSIKSGQPFEAAGRNPLSYLFALFSIGGNFSGGAGIFVFVAVIWLLAAIAIPNLLRAKLSANEALAQATLRSVATAAATYAQANGGLYPFTANDLTNARPPYLKKNYCDQTISGYVYECKFQGSGFTLTAQPLTPGTSGTRSFTATPEGVFEFQKDREEGKRGQPIK